MSGRINTAVDNAVTGPVIRPALLAEFDFSDGVSRVWSGIGTLNWDSKSWLGVGTLGSVEDVEETTELRAVGVRFKLSGIPSGLLGSVTTTAVSGRKAKLWLAFLTDSMTMIDSPVLLLSGKMDTVDITDGGDTLSFELAVENNLRDLQRPRTRRYTDADQQKEFAGDKGFEFVSELQRKEFKWGTKSPPVVVTWSSTDKASSIALSDNKLVATQGASGPDGVRATHATPAKYWELYVSAGTAAAGVSAIARSTNNLVFDNSNAWGSGHKGVGDTISVSVNDGKMYIGINGVWQYDELLQEPIAAATGLPETVFPTAVLTDAGSSVTAKFKSPWWFPLPPWLNWVSYGQGGGGGADNADPGPGGGMTGDNNDAGIGGTGDTGVA